jgi:uncharacterized protein with WD repeat
MNQVGTNVTIVSQSAVLSSVQPTALASLSSLSTPEFSISPNPTEDRFFVKTQGNKPATLIISDLSGRVVKTVAELTDGQAIAVAELPSGTYLVKLDHSEHTAKLIVD